MSFNKFDFLRDLIDDVASSKRAGKRFEADAAILGPLLVGVLHELEDDAYGSCRGLPDSGCWGSRPLRATTASLLLAEEYSSRSLG
jgi:hypothetical protein